MLKFIVRLLLLLVVMTLVRLVIEFSWWKITGEKMPTALGYLTTMILAAISVYFLMYEKSTPPRVKR